MKVTPEELKMRMDCFKDGLRQAGIKLTHQRIEIFREVARSADHPDAETVYRGVRERVPTISLDTVYRTLWLLLDLGLISTLGSFRERARFDANMRLHHHFVCSICGITRDFYCDEFDHFEIPESIREMGSVADTHVEIRGVCIRCPHERKGMDSR